MNELMQRALVHVLENNRQIGRLRAGSEPKHDGWMTKSGQHLHFPTEIAQAFAHHVLVEELLHRHQRAVVPAKEYFAEPAVSDSVLRRGHTPFEFYIVIINLPSRVQLHDAIALDGFV